MASLTDRDIEAIARRIVADLQSGPGEARKNEPGGGVPTAPQPASPGMGIYGTVDEAVTAARAAQPRFVRLSLKTRAVIIAEVRKAMLENAAVLAKAAHEETGLGRVDDKVVKNLLVTEKTPGIEDLAPQAVTGDHGLSLVEPAPFGVIGAITPVTNPTSTIICNAIGMLAAGNAVIFNVHPSARACSIQTVVLLNRAIKGAGGPDDVITCVSNPTIESAQELMRHRGVRLVVVTGGPAVVRAAMASGKRAICAGPGNPPVVVDQTAHIAKAGRDIVLGASTDNNIICTDEKEVLVVSSVADDLVKAMVAAGAAVVEPALVPALERLIFTDTAGPRRAGHVNKDLIGKNAGAILRQIGMNVPESLRLGVVEVGEDHPLLWTEQMMPIMPVCRVPNVDAGIDLAVKVEGGNRHTAVMHSTNIDSLSRMARECDCSIFVKNGRSQSGLGLDAEGYTSFTIASPTGEGLTSPRSFSRWRRCVMVDHFRIT